MVEGSEAMTDESRILGLTDEQAEAELQRVWETGLEAEREAVA